MSEDQGDKTEQATDQRREEFRKRGQVAMTRELGSAVFFLVAAGLIYISGRFFLQNIFEIFNRTMGGDLIQLFREGKLNDVFSFVGLKLVILTGPVFVIALVIGVGSHIAQTGLLQIEDALSPNFNKINPLNGLGRIFSMRGVAELFKSILKMTAVATVMYLLLKSELHQIPYLAGYSISQLMTYMGEILFKLLMGTGFFMLVLALADYFFQRWQLEKEMMMTKEEVKQELKSRDGDPMVKARIRKVQREMATRKMMSEIPKGDVVITNPTHIAVVLKYSDKLPAPQLIAKGMDHMAEKIKQIARDNNIPVIENKPLARTIFKTMKIGQVIPRELFVAVAEVLSYVFRLRRKKRRPAERGL
ncbi:MAG: flagellar biosynthesis protein FlhB [Bdellovibrionales bacterium RIFCSPHIGHO2_01_FULL_40_29]|nr:MAG: flagellar biosynthesis protein FlhB [Bdellovibrionales bacterium RIFCSPHIGHO2_01_FULL_40_29]OFZ32829.1 MAG: flagellar biosynthesis protein FlhB [Bdellovibrionales bacterium RIFCSPHIGHO2_02_FULL_40_15]